VKNSELAIRILNFHVLFAINQKNEANQLMSILSMSQLLF